ncbi:g7143 [Coccomyxa elongata]
MLLRRPVERIIVEDDPRYRRVDMSEIFAWQARRAFVINVARGESGINLAEAALQVAAEDDAIVSHSSVQLPVHSFLNRISRVANDANRLYLREMPSNSTPQQTLQAIQKFLFEEQRFGLPAFGRSNIASGQVLDNPGVYENAKYAYLHELLVTRKGVPAVLAILLEEVCQRLLSQGAIDFAVRVDCSSLDRLPKAEVIPGLNRHMVTRADGRVLNTCSSDVLVEMLRFLKRAYWPFPWQSTPDNATGGFLSAAMTWLEGEVRAELQAIARTAKHRLERGIWTSPGAGDLRRALASSERLCILLGDDGPLERRDVAVLYLHAGDLAAASVHLAAYMSSSAAADAPREERDVLRRIREALDAVPDLSKAPDRPVLSVQSALDEQQPEIDTERRVSLTW